MEFHLKVQCAYNLNEIIENGITIEKALISKGLFRIYRGKKHQSSNNNEKPHI